MGKKVIALTDAERAVLKAKTRAVHKSFLATHRDLIPTYKSVVGKLGD